MSNATLDEALEYCMLDINHAFSSLNNTHSHSSHNLEHKFQHSNYCLFSKQNEIIGHCLASPNCPGGEEKDEYTIHDTETLNNEDSSAKGFSLKFPLTSPIQFWQFRAALADSKHDALATETLKNSLAFSLTQLRSFVTICDSVNTKAELGKNLLSDLENKHAIIAHKTISLHEKIKKLSEEQASLENLRKEIESSLKYFLELDRIGPLLGLPLGGSNRDNLNQSKTKGKDIGTQPHKSRHVRPLKPDSPEFFSLLRRLDECVEYISLHPEFKDHEEYNRKFEQLRLHGLKTVCNFVINSLRVTSSSAKASVEAKLENQFRVNKNQHEMKSASQSLALWNERDTFFDAEINSILYGKFREHMKQLRPQIEILERKAAQKGAAELLARCHKSFSALRLELLGLTIRHARELARLADPQKTLKAACMYLLSVCRDEQHVFTDLFTLTSIDIIDNGANSDFSEDGRRTHTIDLLYDAASFDAGQSTQNDGSVDKRDVFTCMMTELCGVLYDLARPQIVKINDLDTLCEIVRTVQDDILDGYAHELRTHGQGLHSVLLQVLHDVQERLIFSASHYITENIALFEPQPADLDYPKVLVDSSGLSTGALSGWYKSLDKTLQCLVWVYRCVEPPIFEELAQEAVVSCIKSLERARSHIALRSRIDGDLFFITHLLVLREEIVPFNTHLTMRTMDLDFASTTAAIGQFLSNPRNIFSRKNNSLLDLVVHGVPTITEREEDCNLNLETQLKEACEDFITCASEQAVSTLVAFLQRASKPMVDDTKEFHDQDFALPEKLEALLVSCISSVPECLRMIRSKMEVYLVNVDTEHILFNPIKANIFSALTQLSNCIEANYTQKQAKTILLLVSSLRKQIVSVESLENEK